MINSNSSIHLDTLFPVKNNYAVDRIERFLGIFDTYQQRLSNPKVTLREVYPLIQEMEVETEILAPLLDSLPDGDGLKDILNRVLITSSVERL